MLRSLANGRLGQFLMLLALPIAATGCRSTSGSWGWPSMSAPAMSLNPWKSSNSSQLAASKPSGQIPTPPASMLAGSGAANRNAQTANAPAGTNNWATAGHNNARPATNAPAAGNDYGARQVSATQGDGYYTGPYSTNGAPGGSQQGPYAANTAANPNSTAAASNPGAGRTNTSSPYTSGGYQATADRRGDASYGAGGYGGASNGSSPGAGTTGYGASAPANNGAYGGGTPAYGTSTGGGASGGAPTQGGYPTTGSGAFQGAGNQPGATASPYVGLSGQSGGASRSSGTAAITPAVSAPEGNYRPGSTGRASGEVQRTSYENSGSSASPATGSTYPTTGASSAYNSDFQGN